MKDRCYLFFETLGTKLKIDIINELKKHDEDAAFLHETHRYLT